MAKIEYLHPADEYSPAYTETIEARIWSQAGRRYQPFYIGSGVNYQGCDTLWLEILYCVEGAQVFYTRNFLHNMSANDGDVSGLTAHLNEIVEKREGKFGLGGMFPETGISMTLKKSSYEDSDGKEQETVHCQLDLSADVGVVFGRSGPGIRFIKINLPWIDTEEAVRFMRDLLHEIEAVYQGKHPDPAAFPEGSSEFPLVWQLNQAAYNKISEDYQEVYFDMPLLTEAFDGWLAQIPAGGHILDAGCGHGDPVITHLLEKGFQVTGSDFSPAMLKRASAAFPQASFLHQATPAISEQAAFDGICSFNSMLYLDPIDLLNSIQRLHRALKPGGLLFLYAFDNGPDWRGEPFGYRLKQWMWSWHYGMNEAAQLIEEHGYFEVLDCRKVQVDEDEAQRIAEELEKQKQEEEEYLKRQESNPDQFMLPFFATPIEHSPYSFLIIARRREREEGSREL